MLAIAHPSVLLSALLNDVSTPVAIISQLNTQPACMCPCQRFDASLTAGHA